MGDIILYVYQSVNTYSDILLNEIGIKILQTDMSPSVTFLSEAVAESIFSIIEKILEGRESLSIENLNALA